MKNFQKMIDIFSKKKKATKMVRASQKPVSNVDMIADKVSEKIFARMAEAIGNPIANPFGYSATDDST